MPEDEWYELVKSRLDEDEIKDLEKVKKEESETLVDLLSLKNRKDYGN